MPADAFIRLTVAQVAERLATSPTAVLRLIADPSDPLPASNIGLGPRRPRWRIDPAELESWLRHRSTAKRPEPAVAKQRRSKVSVPNYFAGVA